METLPRIPSPNGADKHQPRAARAAAGIRFVLRLRRDFIAVRAAILVAIFLHGASRTSRVVSALSEGEIGFCLFRLFWSRCWHCQVLLAPSSEQVRNLRVELPRRSKTSASIFPIPVGKLLFEQSEQRRVIEKSTIQTFCRASGISSSTLAAR
jgi:hypothetical protein